MIVRVHYNQENNTSEARDENGMCIGMYYFNSDKFEQYDDLHGYTIEEIIEMMDVDREEYNNL